MPRKRRGTPLKNFGNNFQPIPPEAAWHPRCGAPRGNTNAFKTGVYGREIEDLCRRARDLIRASHEALAEFHAARRAAEARLAESHRHT